MGHYRILDRLMQQFTEDQAKGQDRFFSLFARIRIFDVLTWILSKLL